MTSIIVAFACAVVLTVAIIGFLALMPPDSQP
jgi:hypothetical protein